MEDEVRRELLRRMNLDGCVTEPTEDGTGLRILSWLGQVLPRPLLLEWSAEQLEARLRKLEDPGRDAFGTDDGPVAAMQLLMVHIDEAVAHASATSTHLEFTPSGVRAAR